MKEIINRKITKKLMIFLFGLSVFQIYLLIGINNIAKNNDKDTSNYKYKLSENVTKDDIVGLNIQYPVYTEGDIIYFDPVTTEPCNENTFNVSKITNGTSTCYRWRVLETEDSSNKSTVTIQLDHNYGSKVDWLDSADRTAIINNSSERTEANTTHASVGPLSALRMIQQATSTWVRVPLLNYEYDTSDIVKPGTSYETNYGLLKCVDGECKNGKNEVLVQNLRVRMVTPQELAKIAKKNFSDQTITSYGTRNLADWRPDDYQIAYYIYANDANDSLLWLMENLYSDNSRGWTTYGNSSASGYWTMAPTAYSSSQAWDVSDYKQMYTGIADTYNSSIGVRPVVQYDKLYSAFMVTYNDEGRITKKVVFAKDKAPEVDSKGKKGYEFLYWSLKKDGKKAFDFNTEINKNITLYAVYNKKGCTVVDRTTAVDYIEDLYENDATSNNLIYDNTIDNNLRYYNKNPNNYINFNGELWRIVGIFNVEDKDGHKEKRLKIVRNDSIGKYSWDTSHHGNGSDGPGNKNFGNGINEWSQADLMYLLNPGYENHKEPNYYNDSAGHITYDEEYLVNNSLYYNSSSGKCFNSSSNGYTTCDFTNTGLKESSKKYIDTVKWNTGAINIAPSTMDSYDLYNVERGNATGKDGITKADYESLDDVKRTTSWIGQVGLLYSTDTIFSSGNYNGNSNPSREECLSSKLTATLGACTTTNNWLFNSGEPMWTITPTNGLSLSTNAKPYYVIAWSGVYYYSNNVAANTSYRVRPALYLKPNVKLASGDGSQSNPYNIDFVEEQTCTIDVTFDDEGKITKKTIPSGTKMESINSQGKEGYTFKFWSEDKKEEFDFDAVLNDDITLYAVYEENKKPKEEKSVTEIKEDKPSDDTKKPKKSNNPKTYDNIKMYIITLIISTIVLELVLIKYIKNKEYR